MSHVKLVRWAVGLTVAGALGVGAWLVVGNAEAADAKVVPTQSVSVTQDSPGSAPSINTEYELYDWSWD